MIMFHKLADGSLSTDFKVGDKFMHCNGFEVAFKHNDGTENPWFINDKSGVRAVSWCLLTPIKTKKDTRLVDHITKEIKKMEKSIKRLQAFIEELQQ
jgi:hypothetical protein